MPCNYFKRGRETVRENIVCIDEEENCTPRTRAPLWAGRASAGAAIISEKLMYYLGEDSLSDRELPDSYTCICSHLYKCSYGTD